MFHNSSARGFSLLEMVLVLILIALLTVIAAPSITGIVGNANDRQADYIVGLVRSGINIFWANRALENNGVGAYPESLEDGPCCFGRVMDEPVTSGWSHAGYTYTHSLSGLTFTYSSSTGDFE